MRRAHLSVCLAAGSLAALLLMPVSAVASAQERTAFEFSSPGVIDCATFEDNFTDFYSGTEVSFTGPGGDLVRIVDYVEHHSNDTNSLTGVTIHEHGHFTFTFDLVTGTQTYSGSVEIATRPGSGVVVQDVGHFVFDADGNLVFFAGGRNHSEVLIGDQVLCDALR